MNLDILVQTREHGQTFVETVYDLICGSPVEDVKCVFDPEVEDADFRNDPSLSVSNGVTFDYKVKTVKFWKSNANGSRKPFEVVQKNYRLCKHRSYLRR